MKTISLKNVKDGLSRDEMRAVKGGCGYTSECRNSDSCTQGCTFNGVCSNCCIAK